MWHGEFNDPRLVPLYDTENPWSRDDAFFVSVVPEQPARVADLGCGTGRLALGLAAAGHRVTGVDPARASLEAARRKPGADRVTWLDGTSSALLAAAFDIGLMTSHVAQFLITDEEWRHTLADLKRALVPGGRPAFDTRDPRARGWEQWNPAESRCRSVLPDQRVVTHWTETTDVRDGLVSFTHHYQFPDGEELLSTATLRFRSEQDVRSSLAEAGFTVDHMYGGWHREPIGRGDGELLVIAHS